MKVTSMEHAASIVSRIPDRKMTLTKEQLRMAYHYLVALEALCRYEDLLNYDGILRGDRNYPSVVVHAFNTDVHKQLSRMIEQGQNTRHSYAFRHVKGYKHIVQKLGVPYVQSKRSLKRAVPPQPQS